MKNKGISAGIVIAVILIITVGGLGTYLLLSGGGGGAGGESSEGIVWSDVSSLDMEMKIEKETGGVWAEGTMKIKGINTAQMKARVEITYVKTLEEDKTIVNEETEKAWSYSSGSWSSANYENLQASLEAHVNNIEKNFSEWSEGEEITFQIQKPDFLGTHRFYNIDVNTEIDDSLFEDPIENQQGEEHQLENIENQLG